MARVKATDYVENCPISDKAYFTFAQRIMAVTQDEDTALMLLTLKRYLEGDRVTYADGLRESLRIAFEMLRFEIDKAIERSARARARVRCRTLTVKKVKVPKESTQKAESPKRNSPKSQSSHDTTPRNSDKPNDPASREETARRLAREVITSCLSRRDRRAVANARRPKSKWRKLG